MSMQLASPTAEEGLRKAFLALPQPEHVPTRAVFDQEVRTRLAFDPRCRENYEKYLRAPRQAQPDFLPIRLDIENVARCNFHCNICQVATWPKQKRANDMTLEQFQKIIDDNYGLIEIKLHGLGEPLLGGEKFFAMIRYARERHIWVRTVTNASLLHLKNNYAKLIDTGVNEVQISIDGATKEVFESLRGGSVFKQVIANCSLINSYCREKGIERTKMWTVVQEANYPQMPALVDLAAELGFPSMVFSIDINSWGIEEMVAPNGAVSMTHRFDLDYAWSVVERGKKAGVKVGFWGMAESYETTSPDKLCSWPFERGYVSADMRYVPCCMIANPDTLEIGSGPFESLPERWTSKEFTAFRQAHLNGEPPSECRWCYRLPQG